MRCVNILWCKQKKKAILVFVESNVEIAAMLNTKRVTDYAEFNVKYVQKWSNYLGKLGLAREDQGQESIFLSHVGVVGVGLMVVRETKFQNLKVSL